MAYIWLIYYLDYNNGKHINNNNNNNNNNNKLQ